MTTSAMASEIGESADTVAKIIRSRPATRDIAQRIELGSVPLCVVCGRGSSGHAGMGVAAVGSGANTAGNGGDGYFYGSLIHASLLVYEPINISVSLGYGSVALANQSNNLNVDQSAFQMAGVGGHGRFGPLLDPSATCEFV